MMKQMLMVVAMLAVMVAGLAAPAMAEEVQNRPKDPPPVEEEPYKDPGIRQCDLTPTPCQDTDEEEDSAPHEPQVVCIKAPCPGSSDSSAEEEEEPYKDPGIRQCDITPVQCEDTEEQKDEEEPYKDPGIRQCDITPVECEDTDESRDDHDNDNSSAHPDADETNPVKEEANSSGTVEAEQTANGGTIYGCPYDNYEYNEEFDTCVPTSESFGFIPVLTGDEPWPDSAGGYVGLAGAFVEDMLSGGALILQIGLGVYYADTLVAFGESLGPVGWPIQGLGYTLGFTAEAAGVLVEGVSQAVGAVADGVGGAVDAVGEAAGAIWDEVSSWW